MVTTDQFPDGIDPEPSYPHGIRPIHEYLVRHSAENPEKTAITFYGRDISFAELDGLTDKVATVLDRKGYEKGDVLIVYLHNTPQLAIAVLGAMKAGVIPALPMPDGDADRLRHYIDNSEARGIVTHDTYASLIDSIRDTDSLENSFYIRYEEFLPGDPTPARSDRIRESIEASRLPEEDGAYLGDLLETTEADPPSVDISMEDRSLFMYTGGTTGMPKTVVYTHDINLRGSASVATAWQFDEHDRHLVAYQMQRSLLYFSILPHLIFGNSYALIAADTSTEHRMAAIEANGVEIAMVRSPLMKGILEHECRDEYDLSSLERVACLSFQTRLTEEMADRWEDSTGSPVFEYGWGSVELHGVSTFGNGTRIFDPGFIGKPLHGVDIVIRDIETGTEVPIRDVGEITVSDDAMFESYWEMPEKTAEALRDGYFYTEDLGRITEEGNVFYLGRLREVIESDGTHIAPREIERIIEEHPDVDTAGVVGRETNGETELVCAVTLLPIADISEIEEWIASRIDDPVKEPAEIVRIDEFPISNVGKIDRDRLKDQLR